MLGKKIYLDAAYLAFHGGTGESGQMAGLLETLRIPHAGATTEGAVIAMNKVLTNDVVTRYGVKMVDSVRVDSDEVTAALDGNLDTVVEGILSSISLPLIVKPAHLGSSIGISVAKNKAQLKKALITAARVDREIIVEKFLKDMVEYNCAVRKVNGKIEAGEIERPLGKDEILSFEDKYARGAKKTGGAKTAGMASLEREIPAKISDELKTRIQRAAIKAYKASRLESMVRIDFMYSDDELYLTEINPIPGGMAFFIWEASGVSFTQLITEMIEEAIRLSEEVAVRKLDYKTDILEKVLEYYKEM